MSRDEVISTRLNRAAFVLAPLALCLVSFLAFVK